MTGRRGTSPEAAELRRLAEERLRKRSGASAAGADDPDDVRRVVHELQVHQIQMEMQNDELQRVREELEAGLERYTDLYDFAPVGYLTLGRDRGVRTANLTGARLLGLERSRLLGMRFDLLLRPASRPVFEGFLADAFAGRAKDFCEVALGASASGPCWLQVQARVAEDGRDCRVVLLDVTDRRRLEDTMRFRVMLMDFAAAHSLEELIRKTLDEVGVLTDSPIGFYHFVEADQETLSLQAWSTRTMAEFCKAEGRGRHYPIAQAGVWADCVRERRAIIHNDYPSLPHRKGLPPGHAPVARELVVPVVRADLVVAAVGVGNKPSEYSHHDVDVVSYMADVAWEIIERKRAEDGIRESERRYREVAEALHESDRQKTQFLASLSHELRGPLAPIRNSLHVLERVAPGGEQAQRSRATIERQLAHLTRLVEDLLDVTRISQGKVHVRHEPLDLRELVRATVEDHRPVFEANGIGLETAIVGEPVHVGGDPTRLAQAVGNLLSNAAKFTPRGGRTSVALERDAAAAQAVLRVRDTGAGIDAAILPRLFQPFVQADGTLDRSRGGLGLGLAVVKGLVEMHGGGVCADSAGPGTGAEFTIRLPLGTEAPAVAAVPGGAIEHACRRVLVIDDSVDTADTLREVLELAGHEVAVAAAGPAGLGKAREFRPEVVLCDIGLPEMDGYAVARAFRADEALRGMYLVALTGYALPEDLARAREAGFDEHLAKPANPEALEQALARASATARPAAGADRSGE